MSHTPIVSVVMPAFNAQRTVDLAARSVLAQTFVDLELIVCDDASTDRTLALLKSLNDRRVRLLENSSNIGPGASRDRCIAEASGKWVALIDADDAWATERLERLLSAADGPECAVFDDILLCHDTATGMVPWRRLRGTHAFGTTGRHARTIATETYIRAERLLIKPLIPVQAIRSQGLHHSSRRFGEDAEYFLRLAAAGVRFKYLPEALYLYRISPGSATTAAQDAAMRECLERCASYAGFGKPERAAFVAKINQLQDYEAIRRLARHLRKREVRKGLGELVRRPGALLYLPTLALRRLAYEAHRMTHGGARRSQSLPPY